MPTLACLRWRRGRRAQRDAAGEFPCDQVPHQRTCNRAQSQLVPFRARARVVSVVRWHVESG